MAKSIIVEIPEVGLVAFVRSNRAQRLNIYLRPFAGIRVTVPAGVSFATAQEMVRSKTAWFKIHLPKIKELEQKQLQEKPSPLDAAAVKIKLLNRLRELAAKHGFSYGKVSFRQQRTRWGSCSAKNNLSLNLKLGSLPDELLDYVLLHELMHTKIKHHQPRFWVELEKLVGQARGLRKKLQAYNLSLF